MLFETGRGRRLKVKGQANRSGRQIAVGGKSQNRPTCQYHPTSLSAHQAVSPPHNQPTSLSERGGLVVGFVIRAEQAGFQIRLRDVMLSRMLIFRKEVGPVGVALS